MVDPLTPLVPALMAPGGELIASLPRRAVNDAVMGVFQQLGGQQWLAAWVESSEERRDQFVTKLLPKLVVKEVVVDDRRSIDDIVNELEGVAIPSPAGTQAVDDDVDYADYE